MMALVRFWITLVVWFQVLITFAACESIHWNGANGISGNWFSASSWRESRIPGAEDDVFINSDNSEEVVHLFSNTSESAEVRSITVGADACHCSYECDAQKFGFALNVTKEQCGSGCYEEESRNCTYRQLQNLPCYSSLKVDNVTLIVRESIVVSWRGEIAFDLAMGSSITSTEITVNGGLLYGDGTLSADIVVTGDDEEHYGRISPHSSNGRGDLVGRVYIIGDLTIREYARVISHVESFNSVDMVNITGNFLFACAEGFQCAESILLLPFNESQIKLSFISYGETCEPYPKFLPRKELVQTAMSEFTSRTCHAKGPLCFCPPPNNRKPQPPPPPEVISPCERKTGHTFEIFFSLDECEPDVDSGCPLDCRDHGDCYIKDDGSEDLYHCICHEGYKGPNCEFLDCLGDNGDCNGHGSCGLDEFLKPSCLCDPGWGSTIDCRVPYCPNSCSGRGSCLPFAVPTCDCPQNYTGGDCSILNIECSEKCEEHGRCNGNTGKCSCDEGWVGISCSIADCPGDVDCNNRGFCEVSEISQTPYCNCSEQWEGVACEIGRCRNNCSGHGTCLSHSSTPICLCDEDYYSDDCSLELPQICYNDCSGQGQCSVVPYTPNCAPRQEWMLSLSEEGQGNSISEWKSGQNGVMSQSALVGSAGKCNDFRGTFALLPSLLPRMLKYSHDISIMTRQDQGAVGFIFLFQNETNYYRFLITPNSRILQKVTNSNIRTLRIRLIGFDNAKWHKLKLTVLSTVASATSLMSNTTVLISMDDDRVFSFDEIVEREAADNGKIGFYSALNSDSHFILGCPLNEENRTNADFSAQESPEFQCNCFPGYYGNDCSLVDCSSLKYCNSRGICSKPDRDSKPSCECHQGFSGNDCSQGSCPNDCSSKGVCYTSSAQLAPHCDCSISWSGDDCSKENNKTKAIFLCPNNCSGENGVCEGNSCSCDSLNWIGADCSIGICNGEKNSECSNRGKCDISGPGNHVCKCNAGWNGLNCENPYCKRNCSGNGKCVEFEGIPGCECRDPYLGEDCSVAKGNTAIVDEEDWILESLLLSTIVALCLIIIATAIICTHKKRKEKNLQDSLQNSGNSEW